MNTIEKLKAIYFILLLWLSLYLEEPFLFLVFIPFILYSKIDLSNKNKKKAHYLFISLCFCFILIDHVDSVSTPRTKFLTTNDEVIQISNFNDKNLSDKTLPLHEDLDYYSLQNKKDINCENFLVFISNVGNIYDNLNDLYKNEECININVIVINKKDKDNLVKELSFEKIFLDMDFFDNDDFNIVYFNDNKVFANQFILDLTRNTYMRINTLSKTNSYYIFNSKNASLGEDEWD
tara:strand:- start:5729 stop:6433 length:705 start_codon:yes stop_codon:yes gene_type:complete